MKRFKDFKDRTCKTVKPNPAVNILAAQTVDDGKVKIKTNRKKMVAGKEAGVAAKAMASNALNSHSRIESENRQNVRPSSYIDKEGDLRKNGRVCNHPR
jgi:hypothetical protein